MNEFMIQAAPYPTDALPPILGNFVRHLCFSVQVPPELASPLVIAAASAVVQGLVDVESPFGSVIPTSLFCLAIPRSGDRVSVLMRKINMPIIEFEEATLKRAAGIEGAVPFASHQMILGQATEQGIIDVQVAGGDSLIASTDEGDAFFKRMDIPSWCKRWDGDVVRHNTRTAGAIRLKGKRTAMGVTVQYGIFEDIIKRDGKRLLASGFLPRTLFSMPPTLQGYRQSPEFTSCASAQEDEFTHRLRALLADYALKHGAGNFERASMHFSPEAKARFWQFEREIEHRLAPQGEFHDIPAFAAKAVENVIRLAAVFEHVETGEMQVSERSVTFAIIIVWWHLCEAKRAFGLEPPELRAEHHANLLYNWLCQATTNWITQSDLLRYGPEALRKRGNLELVLNLLEHRGVIVVAYRGRSKFIAVRHPRFTLPM